MPSPTPEASHIAAVLDAWPYALRDRWSPAELRDAASRAATELVAGRSESIDTLFAEMRSPAPVLRWQPQEAELAPPQLRTLHRYWNDCRGADELPPSSRIDPLQVTSALGYVMLLEPVDGATDFRYRVYGSRIVEYSRVEMTGRCVWDIPAPLVAAYFVATYRAVVTRRQPLFAHHRTHHAIQIAQWDRLILPFVGDDGAVDRLLVGNVPSLHPQDAAAAPDRRPAAALADL